MKNTFTFNAEKLWEIKDYQQTKNFSYNNGFLQVTNKTLQATYQSTKININTFLELVLSWNFTSLNSDILFMVKLGNGMDFSDFFILGHYNNDVYKSVKNQDTSFGKVFTDLLVNKNLENTFIVLKFIVKDSRDFSLKNISLTRKPNSSFVFDESLLTEKEIIVPKINQKSVPLIGNSICSPTSLTMVLNYYNNNLNNTTIAKQVYDYEENIYGNWSFNASFAYNYGLYSRVEYVNNFKDIISYINNDIPVIMSIGVAKVKDPNNEINYPYGHLVVLTGFTKIDNIWHAIVNDPATFVDEKVLKHYKLDSFLSAFKYYTYIIRKTEF